MRTCTPANNLKAASSDTCCVWTGILVENRTEVLKLISVLCPLTTHWFGSEKGFGAQKEDSFQRSELYSRCAEKCTATILFFRQFNEMCGGEIWDVWGLVKFSKTLQPYAVWVWGPEYQLLWSIDHFFLHQDTCLYRHSHREISIANENQTRCFNTRMQSNNFFAL